MQNIEEKIRLTQFSPGAGCGCKISPQVLGEILKNAGDQTSFTDLLVGNASRDDAAVMAINDRQAIISTTDFFTPIVDDPYDFGQIAANNAISDIYAMGGKPLMAISILGWPVDKLPAETANEVVQGGRAVCEKVGIPLAGGHSIDTSEPIFGLAVTGIVDIDRVKKNNQAIAGCQLYLTKPLGVGLLTTAEKTGQIRDEDRLTARDLMLQLNSIGLELSQIDGLRAMTDVTGFGLLGHLIEMAEGSQLTARIDVDKIPTVANVDHYLDLKTAPGGTFRNFSSYGDKVSEISERQKLLLCDPQTNGGLLLAVAPDAVAEVEAVLKAHNQYFETFGVMEEPGEHVVVFTD